MTIQELRNKIEQLTTKSESTIYYCVINETVDFLEIVHKGTSAGCLWTIDYVGSLSEYLRQETELEEFRRISSVPTEKRGERIARHARDTWK